MFEVIVGLALLPAALVVGFYLLAIGLGAIWFLGGWLLALFGLVLLIGGADAGIGFSCLGLGACWGLVSAGPVAERYGK